MKSFKVWLLTVLSVNVDMLHALPHCLHTGMCTRDGNYQTPVIATLEKNTLNKVIV